MQNKFALAGIKDSLKNKFSLEVKVIFGEKKGENSFHYPEIKFILVGIRLCINNCFTKISLPLSSTFRKKTKMINLSKLIILSYYEELGINYFYFTLLKNVSHISICYVETSFSCQGCAHR